MTLCRRQRTGTAIFHSRTQDDRTHRQDRPNIGCGSTCRRRDAFFQTSVCCCMYGKDSQLVCTVLHLGFFASYDYLPTPPPLVHHIFLNALETLSLLLEQHGLIIKRCVARTAREPRVRFCWRGTDKGSGLRLAELRSNPHRFRSFCCKSIIYYPAYYYAT